MEDEDPIQLPNDELGCPHCKTQLVEGKSSFYFNHVKVGVFDSLKCEFCGYYVLTEKGFIESAEKMEQLGLVEESPDLSAIISSTIKFSQTIMTESQTPAISNPGEKKNQETPAYTNTLLTSQTTATPILIKSKLRFAKK